MLRLLVLILMLCNAIYFAWSQDHLPWLDREPQTEPNRLVQQMNVPALRLLGPQELALIEAPAKVASRPTECLQAGLFDDEQSLVLRAQLTSALPPDSWSLEPVTTPERWIIYLGKYANTEQLARKRVQLTDLNLRFEPVTNPALQPGLSLGHYDSQAAATTALTRLLGRGVRTARVVQEFAATNGTMLRLPSVDDALRARMEPLRQALGNNPLHPCK